MNIRDAHNKRMQMDHVAGCAVTVAADAKRYALSRNYNIEVEGI